MATYSNTLAWEMLWTEEPGGLQSMGSRELDMTKRLNNQKEPQRPQRSNEPWTSRCLTLG